ncbi:MAG TPA: hypothetical protein DEG69_13275 [Flavobacteriaceae bacterium]|nr:hypothetical protein [Flavobacteriaceae bacterium]
MLYKIHTYGIVMLMLLVSINAFSQFYNKDVEAKIDVVTNTEFIEVTGTALNKTNLDQSLRYELSVFRNSSTNKSSNKQSGRFVLKAGEKKNLSKTTINAGSKDEVIVLLLIYSNTENKLIGKDRIVFNDKNPDQKIVLEEEANTDETSTESSDGDVYRPSYGIKLKGIIVEETKTKPGRDFFQMFSSKYNFYKINGEKVVTVSEVLALGINTKIEIKVGDEMVLEFFLSPRNDYLKAMSDQAINVVNRYFINLRNDKEIVKRY